MIKYVTGFMLSPDYKQVALITKNKPSWQTNKLNGIGGKIESGETPSEAMARELRKKQEL
ncbi:NUDIX domain-containing protein (plasmid) [Photobacterium leiognathi subsp. mandapamensis]